MISTRQAEGTSLIPLSDIRMEQMFYLGRMLHVCIEQEEMQTTALNLQSGVVNHLLKNTMVLAAGEFLGCDKVRDGRGQ